MNFSDITTKHNPKPIPDRSWDWEAWRPANYDLGSPTGYGATEEDAVADLKEQLAEKVVETEICTICDGTGMTQDYQTCSYCKDGER